MLYNKYISGTVLKLGGQTTKVLDKGAVEIFGPYGLEKKLTLVSKSIYSLSTGLVTSYGLYILIGLISYLCLTLFSEFNIFIIIHAMLCITTINLKSDN